MLIASFPLQDFAGFLQIISWITLPILLIAILSTITVHYYQKRRRNRAAAPEDAASLASLAPSENYKVLKSDFEALQAAYRASEEELTSLQSEMRRQDFVIDQLREDVMSLEKNLVNLKLALQLKEEQLMEIRQLFNESAFHGRQVIAAEIS